MISYTTPSLLKSALVRISSQTATQSAKLDENIIVLATTSNVSINHYDRSVYKLQRRYKRQKELLRNYPVASASQWTLHTPSPVKMKSYHDPRSSIPQHSRDLMLLRAQEPYSPDCNP